MNNMLGKDDLGKMIKQVNDALFRIANNSLRGEDLTLTQVGVLEVLFSADGHEMTLKEIERMQHVSQPTAYGVVRRMEEKGLVEFFDDSEDQRIRHARLTAAGEEKARKGQLHMKEADNLLVKNLTDLEREQFRELLGKVRDGLVKGQ